MELSAVPSPAAGKSLLAERQRDALVASGLAEDMEALHGVVSIDRKIAIKRDTLSFSGASLMFRRQLPSCM